MRQARGPLRYLAMTALIMAPSHAEKTPALRFAGSVCQNPPVEHCPDEKCPREVVLSQGSVVEAKTGRMFFLDYPCDLKKGEKVTFILSLHGGGSYGNWQRHYFPIMDFKEKYRLVIATPHAPPRVWAEADDPYLQNIVSLVYGEAARMNVKIKAFWLAGHSQGGMTSNRLVRTDFFKEKVDGFVSLSGGRIGGSPGRAGSFGPGRAGATTPAAAPAASSGRGALLAALREPPPSSFSFIYTTGQLEMDAKGIPESSAWASKFNCGARVRRADVVDTKAGYVYDGTRQNPPNPSWGLLPRPGKAEVYEYPKCKDGRVVADVVRIDKGHTEGLEPKVTEKILKLMFAAK